MDISNEIMETADNIMGRLQEHGFYEQHLYCDPFKLRTELELQMQFNFIQNDDIFITDEQFIAIIDKLTIESIDNEISEMIIDGTITMDSVDTNGEIVYKLNSDSN
jgi:hypothetical protein